MIEGALVLALLAAPSGEGSAPPAGEVEASEATLERAAVLLDRLYVVTEKEGAGFEELTAAYAGKLQGARDVGSPRYVALFGLGLGRSLALQGRAEADRERLREAVDVLDNLVAELDADPALDHYRRTVLADAIELRDALLEETADEGAVPVQPAMAPAEAFVEPAAPPPVVAGDLAPRGEGRDSSPDEALPSRRLAVGLVAGGGGLFLVGGTMIGIGLAGEKIAESSGRDPDRSDTEFWNQTLPDRRLAWLISGGIVAGGGAAMAIVGGLMLKKRSSAVAVAPIIAPDGGGLVVGSRF